MIAYKLITLIIFFFLFLNVQGQRKEKHNLILEIHFQSHFKNDTLNMKMKDCSIGRNILLNSDEVLGYANEKFTITSMKKNIIIIRNTSDTTICEGAKSFNIDIEFNRKKYIFPINLKMGRYIGFYKDQNGELQLNQSKKRFSYF